MLESKHQKKIIDFLVKQGWYCVKIISCSKPGFPDLIAYRNGLDIYIETKNENGKLAPLQIFVHKQLKGNSKIVIVPYGFDDFKSKYIELNF